jgi:hypothetical protein
LLKSCFSATAVSVGFTILAFIRHATILISWDLWSRDRLEKLIHP